MAIKKMKFNIDGAADAEPGEGGQFYDGPVPPKGVYRATLKWLKMKTNKNGDPMLNGIVEIAEKGDKAQYNGYGIFFNQNITKQGASYVNQFLDAFGYSRKAFWDAGPTIDTADADEDRRIVGTVTKIGTKKCEDMPIKVSTRSSTWNDEKRLEITRFISLSDADGADDDDEYEEPAAEAVEEEEAESEPEEGEDEAEEEEAEEEGEPEAEDDSPWDDESLREYAAAAVEAGYSPTVREYLKGVAKEFDIRILKKHTEDDLIRLILDAQEGAGDDEPEEAGEPPF